MYSIDYKHTEFVHIRDVPAWDMETDVAVVGLGAAGSCAAIEAADAGANVTIFETRNAGGGAAALSSGELYLGGSDGTRVQKACGFQDSTENMTKFLLASQGPEGNDAKIRLYAENSAEHFNWLVQKGVIFNNSFLDKRVTISISDDGLLYSGSEQAWPFSDIAEPVPRSHHVQGAARSGGILMKTLLDNVEKRNNIKVWYEARALCLVVDMNNCVCGLVVRIDIKQYFIRANKGVILCAGGFTMNRDMVNQYVPRLLRCTKPSSSYSDMGSGIEMGVSVGAALKNMSEASVSVPFYYPATVTYGVFVNEAGQRFINEDSYHGRVGAACLQQPGNRLTMIVSSEDYGDVNKPNKFNAKIIATADSPESLEKLLHMPSNTLSSTLHFYNEQAKKKQDPLFHKSAAWLKPLKSPLLAFDVTPGSSAIFGYFTLGGLDTLPTGEVLREDGSVIKGLYAAGRTTSGMLGRSDGYANGMSLGDATFFGRLAGQRVASV